MSPEYTFKQPPLTSANQELKIIAFGGIVLDL